MTESASVRLPRDLCARPGLLAILFSLFTSLTVGPRLEAQLILNEVLASNRGSLIDDEGDTPDWCELVNTSGAAINLSGYALSDDPLDALRWRFPSIELAPGERLTVWCSGKDRARPSSEDITRRDSTVPFEANFISLDDEWSYLTGAPDPVPPPAGWNTLDFDDAEWEAGVAPLGFGEDLIRTTLPEDMGTVFLRRRFTVEDPDLVSSLVLQVRYDDGFVCYLNGERLHAQNYSEDGEPTFASRSRASTEARNLTRLDFSEHLDLLTAGENILAFALVNLRPTSNDLVLAPELGTVPPVLHTNFELLSSGESLFISDPAGQVIDVVVFRDQTADRSFGRFPDLVGEYHYMLVPTPGEPNDGRISDEPIPDEILFDPPAGKVEGRGEVQLTANFPFEDFSIRYTTDGSVPQSDSSTYEGAIPVSRDLVLRARGFVDAQPVTRISTASYFGFGRTRNLELPVLSIGMEPSDYSFVHTTDGRGRPAEREATLQIFNPSGELLLTSGMGIRLHGGAGRGGGFNIKKAYKAYFRGEYGDPRLRFRMIPDTFLENFDKLVLRSNFNDAFRTGSQAAYIRDQVIRDLQADLGQPSCHGAWYNLTVNGLYRGVYNVVERMDKVFFASYFPADGENWDVIKTGNDVLDGTPTEWNRMNGFFARTNLADPDNYAEAQRIIDVENFTQYMILNIWAQNEDWPHNNWYAARPQREDGQWIFLSWDAEFGLGRVPQGFSSNTFNFVFGRNSSFTTILSALLRNTDYQNYFLEELDRMLAGVLSPANVHASIDRHVAAISGDMIEECSLHGQSFATWQNNIRAVETFADRRGPVIRNHIYNSNRFSFPRATSVVPRRLTLTEPGTVVELRGSRFGLGAEVNFNDLPSPNVLFVSSTRLEVELPFDLSLEGRPTITVLNPDSRSSTSVNLLAISFQEPEPETMIPARGRSGDIVRIFGEDFLPGARVEFGGIPSPSVTQAEDTGAELLEVVVPELPAVGVFEVRVFNTRPGDIPADELLEFEYVATPAFLRGDADGTNRRDITDALAILGYLTAGGELACLDSADVDDTGRIEITDAINLLGYLFLGRAAPPPPFETCGDDPTEDSLDCAANAGCASIAVNP